MRAPATPSAQAPAPPPAAPAQQVPPPSPIAQLRAGSEGISGALFGTDKAAGLLVLGALGALFVLRRVFRGALGD